MSFFPTRNYILQYKQGYKAAFDFVKQNTKESSSLSTRLTSKKFIGMVNSDGFSVISSVKGIGAFSVLRGELKETDGSLKIEINKPYKILIYIIIVLFAGAVLFQAMKDLSWKSLGLAVPVLMFYFFGKFVLNRAFKQSAKIGLEQMQYAFITTPVN